MIRSVTFLSIVTHAREDFEKIFFNVKNRRYTCYAVTDDLNYSLLFNIRDLYPSFLYRVKRICPLHPLHSLLPDRELAGVRRKEIRSPSRMYKEKVIS